MTTITQNSSDEHIRTHRGTMRNTAKFWDKIADKYAKSPIKNVDAYNQTMDRTKAYFSAEDNVLEIGCGTGSTALLLAENVAHITASDISSNMIGIAKSKAREQGVEDVGFVQGGVFDDSLQPGSFDVIMTFNLLHLVEYLPEVVRRIHTLLRPEGRFISKSACLAEQSRLWAIPLFIAEKLGLVPYVNCLTHGELEKIVSGEIFHLVETTSFEASSMNRFIVARKM